MKRISIILLGVLAVAQLAVPVSLIQKKERILREGKVYRFLTRPIDPADPFQGRYVRLGFEHDYIPWSKDEDHGIAYKAKIYALMEIDEDGFAHFSDWSDERPDSGPYLETRYLGKNYRWNPATKKSNYRGIRIDIPFDRFYMDEAKAPRAEGITRNATRNKECWVEVRILDGKGVIEDVFAEGQSLRVLAHPKD